MKTAQEKQGGITQDRLREIFDYREDGFLVRKIKVSGGAKIGDISGCIKSKRYWVSVVDQKSYYTHRLIWLWHHGYMSENQIDHIDRNKTNNRIENLREVSPSCNARNSAVNIRNSSGVVGVSWASRLGKWVSQISDNGKHIYLGIFDCFVEAACHRLAAEQSIGWDGCDSNSTAFLFVRNYCDKACHGR